MKTSDCDRPPRVAGALRSSLEEPKVQPPPKRPGSDVFGRMPAPPVPPPPAPPRAALPRLQRRRRIAGVVYPLLVALAGVGSAGVLFATTRSLPIGLVCAALGILGGVFCRTLLRDRVEVG